MALAALLVANGFFVAGEFGLVAIDRNRLESLRAKGDRRAGMVAEAVRDLTFHLSGAQLGVTTSSLLIGFVAEPSLARLLEPSLGRISFLPEQSLPAISVGVALGIATALQMVMSELVPKNLAIARPLAAATLAGLPMVWLNRLIKPVILALNGLANRAVRLFGIEPRRELVGVRSIEDLERVIKASSQEGELDDSEVALLTRSIAFAEKTAADAMVPRVDIVGLRMQETVEDLRRAALNTGHSRFPIFAESVDEIVGFVHVKDTFRVPVSDRKTTTLSTLTSPVVVVPESQSLDTVLVDLQSRGRAMALVVDEYGGTAGLLTIEDLLEEIIGEIEDEHDSLVPPPTGEALGTILDGSARRHEVEESIGFAWPEGRYETLGGFLMATLGRFPATGEVVNAGEEAFEIVSMHGHRVETVRARKRDQR